MEQVKNEVSVQELLFSFKYWIRYLKSYWVTILLAGALGAVAGLVYALYTKPEYTAKTTFVLEEDESSALGGLGQMSGLAAMVGIDIGGSSNGLFQGDNIAALYKSRVMLEKTLLSKANFNGKEQLLASRYVDVEGLKTKWLFPTKYADVVFTEETGKPETRLADSLLGEVMEDISKKYLKVGKPDKKLKIISVEFTAKDEEFAKVFNKEIVSTVSEFYIETKTKKSLSNIRVLQHQTDSVKAVMNGAIRSAARIVDITPNLNITRSSQRTDPVQRSQFNAEANKAILTELVKNLELSKMNFLKEKPLIQVIDAPVFPIKKERPGKVAMLIFGFFLAVIVTVFWLVFRQSLKRLNEAAS